MVVFIPDFWVAICLDFQQCNVVATNINCSGQCKGTQIINLYRHKLSRCKLHCVDGGNLSTQVFTTDGTNNRGTSSGI